MYRRVLLKLSGEVLLGGQPYGIDPKILQEIAKELQKVVKKEIQTTVVVGGGNIFRGMKLASQGVDRATADTMGMLATVMNALALQDALEQREVHCRVMTAIAMHDVAEPYIRRRAIRHLEKGRLLIFAAGTGNPFFTTDTAAALRASEVHADVLLKGSKVDGVYDSDPVVNKRAKRYRHLDYHELLKNDLGVMDAAAISLCRENGVPIVVFRIAGKDVKNISRAAFGESVGTLVS